jgi:predicted SprT family Zn-dependent metalloprotease
MDLDYIKRIIVAEKNVHDDYLRQRFGNFVCYDLRFTNCDKTYGAILYGKKQIEISNHFIEKYGLNEALDTLRHEIAHLACFLEHGFIRGKRGQIIHHGKEWRKWAILFCARPRATN